MQSSASENMSFKIMSVLMIAVAVMLSFILTGCVDWYYGTRPSDQPYTRWECDNPNIYFDVLPNADTDTNHGGEDGDSTVNPVSNVIKGKIVVDGNEYGFDVSFGHGTTVWFWSRGNQSVEDGAKLFAGDCKFSKDKLTVYRIRYNDYGILPDDTEKLIFTRVNLTIS